MSFSRRWHPLAFAFVFKGLIKKFEATDFELEEAAPRLLDDRQLANHQARAHSVLPPTSSRTICTHFLA